MNPFPIGHVQFRSNSSNYFAQITQQLRRMSDAIEDGKAVMLELKACLARRGIISS